MGMTETTVRVALGDYRQQLEAVAEKYHVGEIQVFGSFARGEAVESSDLDLIAETSHLRWGEYLDFCEEMEALFGRKVEILSKNILDTEFGKYIQDDLRPL